MRCPMWGEGKRVGERRGSRVEVIGEMRVFSFFIFCSSGGFVYKITTSGLRRLTSCL